MNITVLNKNDVSGFLELIMVFEKTFEMENFTMPARPYLQKLLSKEDFFVVTAEKDAKIVGGLTVYILHQYYSTKPSGYLYDLAVLPDYQRQGIGGKLIAFTTSYCREKGFDELYVQADKTDLHAVDFYRKTNPSGEEDVFHYSYSL